MKRIDFERNFWEEKSKVKDVDREMHDPGISTEKELQIILGEIPLSTKRILEIGCGVGRLIIPLAEYRMDIYFYGVDISEGLISIAKKRSGKSKLYKDVELINNDGRSLPFEDNYFSFIYSVTVFQHIDSIGIERYFKEVGKKLQYNGRFFFQFIEGDESEPMSHHYDFVYISKLLSKFGVEIIDVKRGLIYKNWTWVTAKKTDKRLLASERRHNYEPMPSWA